MKLNETLFCGIAFRLHFRKIYGWKTQGMMMMMKKPATMDADDEDVDDDDDKQKTTRCFHSFLI